MSIVTIPYVFTVGSVIVAAQHNSNFSVVANDYNGNIQDVNIASNAAIGYAKLALNASVKNTDLAVGVGTSANNIVALNGSSKLPAVDGSQLTNITNSNLMGNQLGTWVSKSNGTTYQAATDGFVLGFGAVTNGGTLAMYTDSNASPSTQRVSIAVTFNGTLSAMMPVRKNDYWVANGSGETWTTLFFLPMGS